MTKYQEYIHPLYKLIRRDKDKPRKISAKYFDPSKEKILMDDMF